MKVINIIMLVLVVSALFLAGCESEDTDSGEEDQDTVDEEDTGISDVFGESADSDPPPIPS
jgi:PBP1b-binding outer membrane lipoprotein LpoB